MKKLRPLWFDKKSARVIHHFAALSRIITNVAGRITWSWNMDTKAAESPFELSAGTPLPCTRRMPVQKLTPSTPATLVGGLLMLFLAVPRALVLAPSRVRLTRRRA